MKEFSRSLLTLFIIVTAMFVLVSNVSASDWKVAFGGISEDESSSIGNLTFAGTGTPTASISISVGTGQAFFNSNTIMTPRIDISASKGVIAQVAVGLGANPTQMYYHDPDNFFTPWSNTLVEFFVSSSKSFDLFSIEASIIANAIPGDEALEPFGIFVRVLDNRTLLEQTSFTGYVLSPNLMANPVQAPW